MTTHKLTLTIEVGGDDFVHDAVSRLCEIGLLDYDETEKLIAYNGVNLADYGVESAPDELNEREILELLGRSEFTAAIRDALKCDVNITVESATVYYGQETTND